MIKKIKRPLSILLVFLMVVSVFAIVPLTVSAAPADFSTTKKAVFVTDSQGWDSDGVLYAYYWKVETSYPAPNYTKVETVVDGEWVATSYLYDNSLGQSVYGVAIPDDANWIKFNRDDTRQTSDTKNVYNGSWWYIDNNKDCQPCSGDVFKTAAQTGSLSADFVTNTGAGGYFDLDGKYYYIDANGAIAQYTNTSELMVAEVVGGANNGKQYTDVNEAVAAAGEDGEVKLIADIKSNVGIDGDYTTTLDLNGHTITNTSGSGITLYTSSNGKTITIKDTSEPSTGGITINKKYTGDGCISDSSGRKVVIEGGTYTSDANALYVSSDEGWTINGGTFNGNINAKSTIEITGGTVNGTVIQGSKTDYSSYPFVEVPATIEISGGTFSTDVSQFTTRDTYQNANGEVVPKAANTIYDDGDFATAAAEGGNWYIVADVNGDGVTVTSNLKIWNTDKNHTISGNITVADNASIAKGGKKKVTFTGTVTLGGGNVSDANFTNIVVENDPYVHGQINNVPSGAIIKDGDGNRIVYDAISLAYAAKNGGEVTLVDDISDMYMTMNVNSGTFKLHGDGHTVNFTFDNTNYGSAIAKGANIEIDNLKVTVASGKALKSFIQANAADDNTGSVTINNVSAEGFSTDNVYTGGGDWTFVNATITSETEPECPGAWMAIDNNDGTWTITSAVAQNTDTGKKYETLAEAISEASTGNTITVLADCTAGDVTVPAGKELTIDFADKTVTVETAWTFINKGTLTVTGTTGGLTGTYGLIDNYGVLNVTGGKYTTTTNQTDNVAIWNNGNSTTNISGGTIETTCYGVFIGKGDTVNVTNGTLISHGSSCLSGNGSGGNEGYTINVSGGTITSDGDIAIYHPNQGTLNITGGTITGATAIYIKSGTTDVSTSATTIEGATIVGNGEKTDFQHTGNGCYPTGDAIVIENCGYPGGTPSIEISGGKINSTNAKAVASYGYQTYEPVENFVSGGTFNTPVPEAYCAEGYAPKDNGDGTYTVQKKLFVKHTIELTGDIGVRFFIDPSAANIDMASVTKAVAKFSVDNGHYTGECDLVAAQNYGDGWYLATFTVPAAYMAHKITAEVYFDGVLAGTDEYSVQMYADEALKTATGAKKTLIQELLNYGAKAYTVFKNQMKTVPDSPDTNIVAGGYTMAPVTADQIQAAIDGNEANTADKTPLCSKEVADKFGAFFAGSSVIYLEKSTLRLYFTAKGDNFDPNAFKGNKGSYYYVEKTDIVAAELDKYQQFKVGSTTFYYSALDYAKLVVNSTKMSDTEKALAQALYLYNQAAKAYFS